MIALGTRWGIVLLATIACAHALDRAPILAHIAERHPDVSADAERAFWNDAVGDEAAELRKWSETERDPFVKIRLLQGVSWLQDTESKAWVRDQAVTATEPTQQLALTIGIGLNQGEEAVSALEKIAQKAKSLSVKREARRAFQKISERGVEAGDAALAEPAWVKALPDPESAAFKGPHGQDSGGELLARPGASVATRANTWKFPGKWAWNGKFIAGSLDTNGSIQFKESEVEVSGTRMKVLRHIPGKPDIQAEWTLRSVRTTDSAENFEIECLKPQVELDCIAGKTKKLKLTRLGAAPEPSPKAMWVRLESEDAPSSGLLGAIKGKE